jgi:hypothetical protein
MAVGTAFAVLDERRRCGSVLRGQRLHTDDHPVLEYVGPKRVRTDIGEKTVESLWRFGAKFPFH